jgi:protein-S-isoprenylcysteine O-methyltransferase Ste14
MNPKLIAIIAFSYLYVLFEILMSLRQKRGRTIETSSDKGSIWVLIFSIVVGYALSFSIGATTLGRIHYWDAFFAAGVFLVITGLYIRISAILTLKKHFTYTVTRIEHHELIETGLYRHIRHPGYLGQLIIFLGIAICMSNGLSVVGMMLPVTTGFLYRISVEEAFMQQQMGQTYTAYKRRTNRLIPTRRPQGPA